MTKKADPKKKKQKPCKPCKKGKPQRDSRGRCRCYEDEYNRDHKSKKAKQDRSSRRRARAKLNNWRKSNNKPLLSKNRDVDHKDGNPRNNSLSNLRDMDIGENRGRSNKERTKTA